MTEKLELEDYIPPNFDLKKYDALASFSAKDWLTNIVARLPNFYDFERSFLLAVYGGEEGEIAINEIDPAIHHFSETGEHFLKYPNIMTNDVDINLSCGSDRILDLESSTYRYILRLFSQKRIESISVEGIMGVVLTIEGHPELKETMKILRDRDEDDNSTPAHWKEIYNLPATHFTDYQLKEKNHLDYVEIDFRLPDNVLIDNFTRYLSQRRQDGIEAHTSRDKYFTGSKLRRWFESRAIPYLDLIQWNEKQGRKVPHAVAGKVIFSDLGKNDFRVPASMIADTTLKNIKEMTSREVLIMLASQAEIEITV